ncbi:sulfatase-like hydrolase/transferase [Flammeovirga sp. SJP92]|uniref:sulfatase-like hydrolase/transferase n=1 Tax=Flammeovirga sp. SJP92 TaxID=1775430 RepID=UPI000787BFFA|nr:sulfatase-like hydrolase/transferase [Flammeovirga sp. SJP92]KXX66523.1 hypothetical protein AVL50_31860 [Flammeovirga sp. SJP92]
MKKIITTLLISLLYSNVLSAQNRPNIVFILAHDLGWSDTSCYGSTFYKTKYIDQLADSGIKYTSAYANSPNGTSSRASIISGQVNARTGIYNAVDATQGLAKYRSTISPASKKELPLDKFTLGNALQYAGYSTAFFGKWNVGEARGYRFNERGFEEGFQINKSIQNEHGNLATYPSLEAIESESGVRYLKEQTYLSDFITDNAVSYIERHAKDHKPFFMMVSQFFVNDSIEGPGSSVEEATKNSKMNPDTEMTAMTLNLDKCVQLITKKLREKGVLENTLIVFMSANGGVSNLLKGGKNNVYEGGIRVPLIVSWPNKIRKGQVSEDLIVGTDLYPTFLEIAGINSDQYQKQKEYILDGESFKNQWLKRKSINRKKPVVFHFPAYVPHPEETAEGQWIASPMAAVNDGEFKLIIHLTSNKKELYKRSDDIGEYKDLSLKFPEKVKSLTKVYDHWVEETGALKPVKREAVGLGWGKRQFQENNEDLKKILNDVSPNQGIVLMDYVVTKKDQNTAKAVIHEILYELNGKPINSLKDLEKVVSTLKIGDDVIYKYSYSGKRKKRTIKVTETTTHTIDFQLDSCTDTKSVYSRSAIDF